MARTATQILSGDAESKIALPPDLDIFAFPSPPLSSTRFRNDRLRLGLYRKACCGVYPAYDFVRLFDQRCLISPSSKTVALNAVISAACAAG